MDSNQPTVYLDVPVTEAERNQAKRRRDDSSDRLLPEPVHHQHPEDPSSFPQRHAQPGRFPSIPAAPVIRNIPPSTSQRFENHQYVPISPIHEEDEPESINLRESSVYKSDQGSLLRQQQPTPPLWTPVWLKRPTIVLFAIFFALLVLALALLWHFDHVNDGFYVANGMKQYAWAYAPTVIAVVIVAAWRMVDYHSKLAMPFDALQDGPLKPSESLFVDYISKFQLVALYEAIKSNHFAVITTVTGFVLLKIVTVFSTGLLVLLPTQVTQKEALIQARGFSSEAFDPSASSDSLSLGSPVYAYYGTKMQGIPLENGVAFDLAYGALTVSSNTSIGNDAVISGNVTAFVPNMTCIALEEVKLDTPAIVNDTNSADAFATSSNISLTIQAGHVCSQSTSISVPADNPYTEIVSGRQVTGTMQEIYCGTTAGNVPDSQGPLGLLFTLTDIEYQQTLFDNATQLAGGTFTIASDVSRTLTNMTNVFCKPSYAMAMVKVTNSTQLSASSQAVSVESIEGSVSSLPNFSNWNSTNVFIQSATSANALFGDIVNDDTSSNSSGIFTLLALTAGSQDIGSLMEPGKMMSAAEDTYIGVLSQYAHQSLRAASTSDVDGGTLTKQERRLRVNDVSAWTMASIFGLLVIFCTALIFIAPRAVVPRDPTSIAAIATLLTRSTELNRLLRKQGVPSYANQRSALSGFEFGTAIATTDAGTTSFKIVASEGEPDPAAAKPNMDLKWWMPFTASLPVLIIALLLPLVLIAVLEVIQQSSDKHHGLLTVVDDKWTEVYSHYIPGIVTLIVAAFINMLDFNVALFAPWVNLAKGDAVSRRSVLNHLLGLSPPWAFLRAIRTRYLSALLSIPAAALASILTILVSGLYTVQHVTVSGPAITLNQLDSFQLKWSNSFSSDNGAAAITDLIMHQNFSYPQFTYEGLVFPKLSLNSSAATSDSASIVSGSSTHILPGVRANLRCEILPASSFSVTTEQAGSDSAFATNQAFVTTTASLPDSCHLGGSSGSDSTVTYENNFELPSGDDGTYAGAQIDLLFGQNATTYGNYGEARGQYIGDNPAVGCPSLAFTFGHFKLGSTDQSQVTTMICYQEIQKLQANVTLRDNTTTIDASNPPIVQEGSVSVQSNPASTTGAKSFDFRIQNNLAQEMTLFNGPSGTPITNPSATNTFDIYFQAIINGTNKHDPASLVGAKNQNALVAAINQFYRIYMAQAISTNMRASLTSSSSRLGRRQSAITTSTMATTVTTPRLVQDKDSKLELQIILGVITVLAGASWLTTKMRRVLPCNPCSLAGTMSLLAGSDLCHSADEGLCECCGKPRRRSFGYGDAGTRPESIHAAPDDDDEEDERRQIIPDGAEWMPQLQFETIFGGKRYSMGWWRERRAIGKRRRFGVDVGVRADGADDQDWELGERRPEGPGFGDFMRRGGDRDGRGEYARFGGRGRDLSPDPAAVEASALEEREVVLARPPRAASPNPSCPMHGAGGDPPPRTVAHQRESAYLLGGEA